MTRTFTGRHITAILVVGFGVVMAVNFTMAALASSTFGGVVVENSYVASQKYNTWLEEGRQDKALGWDMTLERSADGRVRAMASGVPAGATVNAVARHPLGRLPDRALTFAPDGSGSYISREALDDGRWIVRLTVTSGDRTWRAEKDMR